MFHKTVFTHSTRVCFLPSHVFCYVRFVAFQVSITLATVWTAVRFFASVCHDVWTEQIKPGKVAPTSGAFMNDHILVCLQVIPQIIFTSEFLLTHSTLVVHLNRQFACVFLMKKINVFLKIHIHVYMYIPKSLQYLLNLQWMTESNSEKSHYVLNISMRHTVRWLVSISLYRYVPVLKLCCVLNCI